MKLLIVFTLFFSFVAHAAEGGPGVVRMGKHHDTKRVAIMGASALAGVGLGYALGKEMREDSTSTYAGMASLGFLGGMLGGYLLSEKLYPTYFGVSFQPYVDADKSYLLTKISF